jgi:hypothetical protein
MNSTEGPMLSGWEVANEEFPSDGAIGFCVDQLFDPSGVRGLFAMSPKREFLHSRRNNVLPLFQRDEWGLL